MATSETQGFTMADPRFDSNFTIYLVCRHSSSLTAQKNAKIDILTAKVDILTAKVDILTAKVDKMEQFQAEIDKIGKNVQNLRKDVRYLEAKDDDRERLKDENQELRQRTDLESCDNLSVEDVWNSREF